MKRRKFLALFGAGVAALHARAAPAAGTLSLSDEAFLDDLQRRCFRYFLEKTDPDTGLTLDRARFDGGTYTASKPRT